MADVALMDFPKALLPVGHGEDISEHTNCEEPN